MEILENDETALEKLYTTYIHSYLDIHFGEKSVSVVKNLLTHLRGIGAKRCHSILKRIYLKHTAAERAFSRV